MRSTNSCNPHSSRKTTANTDLRRLTNVGWNRIDREHSKQYKHNLHHPTVPPNRSTKNLRRRPSVEAAMSGTHLCVTRLEYGFFCRRLGEISCFSSSRVSCFSDESMWKSSTKNLPPTGIECETNLRAGRVDQTRSVRFHRRCTALEHRRLIDRVRLHRTRHAGEVSHRSNRLISTRTWHWDWVDRCICPWRCRVLWRREHWSMFRSRIRNTRNCAKDSDKASRNHSTIHNANECVSNWSSTRFDRDDRWKHWVCRRRWHFLDREEMTQPTKFLNGKRSFRVDRRLSVLPWVKIQHWQMNQTVLISIVDLSTALAPFLFFHRHSRALKTKKIVFNQNRKSTWLKRNSGDLIRQRKNCVENLAGRRWKESLGGLFSLFLLCALSPVDRRRW